MANLGLMPLLTELEEFNGRVGSINISLLAEVTDISLFGLLRRDWDCA